MRREGKLGPSASAHGLIFASAAVGQRLRTTVHDQKIHEIMKLGITVQDPFIPGEDAERLTTYFSMAGITPGPSFGTYEVKAVIQTACLTNQQDVGCS